MIKLLWKQHETKNYQHFLLFLFTLTVYRNCHWSSQTIFQSVNRNICFQIKNILTFFFLSLSLSKINTIQVKILTFPLTSLTYRWILTEVNLISLVFTLPLIFLSLSLSLSLFLLCNLFLFSSLSHFQHYCYHNYLIIVVVACWLLIVYAD